MKRMTIGWLAVVWMFAACGGLRAEESLPLAGEWRFARDEAKEGVAGKWYAAPLPSGKGPAEIALPGSTDQARAGLPNSKKPDYSGLYRANLYVGPAWYQREIDIPKGWKGKCLTLSLERCHWTNRVWIDDRDFGTQDSLIAPQVFDLGSDIAPGRHRLTICVDNTLKYDLGPFPSINFEGTQTNWNGIVGRIELRADDQVAIEGLQVYPDVDGKRVRVVARVANRTGREVGGRIEFSVPGAGKPVAAIYDSAEPSAEVVAEVPMGDDFKTWDEFSPYLYTLKAVLTAGENRSGLKASFGMRKLAARGTQFTMNGRPLLLRGTLECAIFPLTGFPPTDVESWRRIYRIEKAHGLNFIRFHSWCPPEAAFAAADLEGIYIQAEAPVANVDLGSNEAREAFLEQEFLRMIRIYGNHPSFCLMALGNEAGFTHMPILVRWIDMLTQADPRHLYTNAASGGLKAANRQWTERGIGSGVNTPATVRDVRDVVAQETIPILGHEIGQWAVYPNLDEIPKYSGVLRARNFELVRDDLKAKGLLDQAHAFFESSGRVAALLYKEEMEIILRTPGIGGFSMLDLHDYPGQGTALVGLLDPFWDSKGFVTPAAFKSHTGPIVPLLRLPKRAYAADEKFEAQAQLAQYGPKDLPATRVSWKIADAAGQEIASGYFPAIDAPTGGLTDLGKVAADFGKAKTPCKATVTLSIDGRAEANSWDIWIYPPAGTAPAPPAGTVVSQDWTEARAALAEGKTVLFFPKDYDHHQTRRISFKPVFWSPVWFHHDPCTMGILCDPKHPLFAAFPTDFFGDWQWWNLLNGTRAMILDDAPAGYRPLVQVIDNFVRNQRLGTVFETSVGRGKLLVCTLPVVDAKLPECAQFLRSLYAYAGSSAFRPKPALGLPVLDRLFTLVPSHLQKLAIQASADSEAPGHPASNVLDDDPATSWQSAGTPMPHSVVLDLGQERALKGITYRARQEGWAGRILQCRVYVGNDPKNLGAPVYEIPFANTEAIQTLDFPKTAHGRYLKVEALSLIEGDFAAIADIDLIFDDGS